MHSNSQESLLTYQPSDHEARISVLERADRDYRERFQKVEAKLDKIIWGVAGIFLTVLAQIVFQTRVHP